MLLISRLTLIIGVLNALILRVLSVKKWLFSTLLFSVTFANAASLSSLNYLTEEYPPYNFSEDGVVKGISVDLLIEAAHHSGVVLSNKDITIQPWARAYRDALVKPNVALFSMTRTPSRETLFKWVGPISKTRVVVLAKKSNEIVINESLDLAQFKIGVIRDDVGEQLLISHGIPRDSMQESSYAVTLAEQLHKGRIDLWAYEENVAKWWIQVSGYKASDFEPVYILQEGELFYAFNTHIDDDTIDSLQAGLDALKSVHNEDDVSHYQTILNRYQ